jgi:hypothetical protein
MQLILYSINIIMMDDDPLSVSHHKWWFVMADFNMVHHYKMDSDGIGRSLHVLPHTYK